MLYGIILIIGVIVWKQSGDKRYAFLTALTFAVVSVIGAVVLYLPVILVSGLDTLVGNKWVAPRPWGEIAQKYIYWLWSIFPELLSSEVAIVVVICFGLQRLFFKPQRQLITLAFLPLAVFLFPLLHRTLPYERAIAVTVPLILLFWGGFRMQWLHIIYGSLAWITSLLILLQGLNVVRNDIAGASDHAAAQRAHW